MVHKILAMVIFRAKALMMISFKQFVGSLFKDIQPFSNFEIIRKKLKICDFKGYFMRHEIRGFCGNDECFILNTDDSSSPGTHWVAVNITGASSAGASGASTAFGATYYFDSFSLGLTEEIKRYCEDLRFHSLFEFQKPNEVICRHLCLYFLHRKRYGKQDFYTVLNELYYK